MRRRGRRGILFENEGSVLLGTMFTARDEPAPTVVILHGIPGIEKNHDLAHAFRDAGMNAVIFHYRGSWGSGGDYRISGVPSDVAIHPEADHAFIDLRPWLIERVVSWVERLASSQPGVPGRDG